MVILGQQRETTHGGVGEDILSKIMEEPGGQTEMTGSTTLGPLLFLELGTTQRTHVTKVWAEPRSRSWVHKEEKHTASGHSHNRTEVRERSVLAIDCT